MKIIEDYIHCSKFSVGFETVYCGSFDNIQSRPVWLSGCGGVTLFKNWYNRRIDRHRCSRLGPLVDQFIQV
jgi:hypothetical protein